VLFDQQLLGRIWIPVGVQ